MGKGLIGAVAVAVCLAVPAAVEASGPRACDIDGTPCVTYNDPDPVAGTPGPATPSTTPSSGGSVHTRVTVKAPPAHVSATTGVSVEAAADADTAAEADAAVNDDTAVAPPQFVPAAYEPVNPSPSEAPAQSQTEGWLKLMVSLVVTGGGLLLRP